MTSFLSRKLLKSACNIIFLVEKLVTGNLCEYIYTVPMRTNIANLVHCIHTFIQCLLFWENVGKKAGCLYSVCTNEVLMK